MKITILVFNLSSNSLVRTYPIAKALQKYYDIEIVGWQFAKDVFPPYKEEFSYKVLKGRNIPLFFFDIKYFMNQITGNVIYAFKPRLSSFGIALLVKLIRKVPVVLDIEDWESGGYYHHYNKVDFIKDCILLNWHNPNSFQYTFLTEKLIKFGDQITVVSHFLQQKFGGTIIYHGADTNFFDPQKYNKKGLVNKWGVKSNEKLILFAGVARPYKGVENILEAMQLLNRNDVKLLLVGGGRDTPYVAPLLKKWSEKIIHLDFQPHSLMPELLTISDIVVLPQKVTNMTRAQVPGKIFEAMAMAKPIISTNVSDIPLILSNGCGMIVGPNNPKQLAEKIQYLLDNEKVATEMGRKAREKCIKEYSYDAMEKILTGIFSKYER
ncbi:D-inositol-3-phosphate glycosyltransferase [subsurface metagenome]